MCRTFNFYSLSFSCSYWPTIICNLNDYRIDIQFLTIFSCSAFTDKGKFLLAARRCRRGAHTEYIITLDADDLSQGSNAYVGKLRCGIYI